LIRADSSDVVSAKSVSDLRSVVPHAESIDVSNAHHMVIADAADVFTGTIVGWMEKAIKKGTEQTTNKMTSKL
jgi:hypothetical protein